ncbi:MAG TPA: glycosyltransferase, partial [Planctomycetota bacterium]
GRQRLLHHFPDFPAERVRAVHLGVDHTHFRVPAPERVAATKARLGLKRPFLLQVGLLDRHKNPETSLAAFADSCARAEGWELVFAGGEAGDQRRILEERARALGVADSVRLLGGVSGAELPQLYAAAGLLLFPSWYEGFGLPVLEAMACGTAGVASSACGIPEIAAAAWPLADPAAPEAFAAAVDRLLQSPDRIDAARRSGLGHAARFTWERCVKETIGFLELGSDNG